MGKVIPFRPRRRTATALLMPYQDELHAAVDARIRAGWCVTKEMLESGASLRRTISMDDMLDSASYQLPLGVDTWRSGRPWW